MDYRLDKSIPQRPGEAKPVIIVQARVGSVRLPAKVTRKLDGKPVIACLLERLEQTGIPIILATTESALDDVLTSFWSNVFRGSENDVLKRYYDALQQTQADAVVRITADCPLSDPQMILRGVDLFYYLHVDYVTNTMRRTYPRGFDIEIIRRGALERAHHEAKGAWDREHVTPYIRSGDFTSANFIDSEDLSEWRLTIDTEDDFKLIEKIVAAGDALSFSCIKDILHCHPDWKKINEHVEQKEM